MAGTTTDETELYVDADGNFASIFERLAGYDANYVSMRAEPAEGSYPEIYRIEGAIGSGAGFNFDVGQFEFVFRFEGQANVAEEDVQALRNELLDGSGVYDGVTSVNTAQAGQFLIVTGEFASN